MHLIGLVKSFFSQVFNRSMPEQLNRTGLQKNIMSPECQKKRRRLVLLYLLIFTVSVLLTGCSNEKAKAAFVARGEAYLKESKYHEASLEFRNAIQLDYRMGAAHWGLARAYEGLERYVETIEELRLTIRYDTNNLDARVKLGNYFLVYNPPVVEEADKLANFVLQRNPNHIEANILKASVLAAMKRPDEEVFRILDKVVSLDPNRAETQISIANFYMSKNDVVKAEEGFRKAITMKDNSALIRMQFAKFLSELNRMSEAEEQYRHAVQVEPKNREAHKALAAFYVETSQSDKAEESYKALASLDPTNPEGLATLADFYASIERNDEAISIYREAIKKWPDYTRGRYRLGEMLLVKNDVKGALDQAEALLTADPRDVDGLLLRARVKLERGLSKDALKDLDEVIRYRPTSRSGWFYTAEARLRVGQLEQARGAAAELERQYPTYFSGKLISAQISFAAGDIKNALRLGNEMVEMLKNAVASGQTSPQELADLRSRAFSIRGLAHLQSGNLKVAREDLTEAQRLSPNIASSNGNLGRIALAERKADEALQAFEQALKIDSKSYDAFNGLISAFEMKGQLDHAHQRLDQAINENANDKSLLASLHYLKSTVFSYQNDMQGAEAELNKTLTIDPNYLPAYSTYAALLVRNNRVEEAIAQYKRVLERRPNDAATYTLIAMLEENKGNLDLAVEGYKKALENDANSAIAANNLAWLYAEYDKGNIDEAVRLAQNIVQRFPEEPGYADTLGWIYYKKGAYASAIPLLQKCVELDAAMAVKRGVQQTASYRYRLGMALAASGDRTAARRELEQALSIGKFPEADEARKALSTL